MSKDRTRVTGKGGSSRWARQAAAQASFSTNGFLISGLLRPVSFYRLPAALLGASVHGRTLEFVWKVRYFFGVDREMAGQYVANMRQAILKELKAAYHKIEIIEEFSYGKYSYFRESGPEPELGAKRRRDGKEAMRS